MFSSLLKSCQKVESEKTEKACPPPEGEAPFLKETLIEPTKTEVVPSKTEVELKELPFDSFLKPAFTFDEGLRYIPPHLETHFCFIIVGPPGSGKSTLIYNLLYHEKLYYKKFDKIFFFSPDKIIGFDKGMNERNWKKELDLKWLKMQIDNLNIANSLNKEVKVRNILIIFDDMIASVKKELIGSTFMHELLFNRRHKLEGGTISLIFTAQKYLYVIPQVLRNVISGIFLFKPSMMDLKAINQEYWGFQPSLCGKVVGEIFNNPMFKSKFDKFIFIYYQRNSHKFWVNFNPLSIDLLNNL